MSEWVHRGNKRVAVAEDWSPTVDGLVDVIWAVTDTSAWVGVWGGDDDGMVFVGSPDATKRVFDRIGHLVTKSDLRSWGFVQG